MELNLIAESQMSMKSDLQERKISIEAPPVNAIANRRLFTDFKLAAL